MLSNEYKSIIDINEFKSKIKSWVPQKLPLPPMQNLYTSRRFYLNLILSINSSENKESNSKKEDVVLAFIKFIIHY